MATAVAITGAFCVVALCTAVFNLWIFLVRRRGSEQLWLAVAACGIFGMAAGTAYSYVARSVADAQAAQLTILVCAVPLVVGFLRFSALFLSTDLRRLEQLSAALLGVVVAVALVRPDWVFLSEPILVPDSVFTPAYVRVELGRAGYLLFPMASVAFAGLIAAYWRNRHRFERPRAVTFALSLWSVCGFNDLLVGAGVYNAPYLMALGYTAFAMVFTGILVGRFVDSMERAEESAEQLQHLVEERSQELREKELQLAHGARMATVGALAAGLAHEINNPIAFISANLNQLAAAWKDPAAEDLVEEMLTETREGVERIRAIVSELLRLARRGQGRVAPVDLPSVVESVLPIVRHETVNRAQIVKRLAPVPPVMGDEGLLGQVVLNLVVNALHAIPEGDAAHQRVTVATSFEDGSVWLVVADTGTGIAPDVLPRIFDPFFTTKEDGKGTGLGLAVTHELVTRHRGRIDVATDRRGSTFTVELPPAPDGARRGLARPMRR